MSGGGKSALLSKMLIIGKGNMPHFYRQKTISMRGEEQEVSEGGDNHGGSIEKKSNAVDSVVSW
jgi:hypothetical protein